MKPGNESPLARDLSQGRRINERIIFGIIIIAVIVTVAVIMV